MPLLSQRIKEGGFAKSSGSGSYLNPSAVAEGEKLRITILGEDSLEGWEAWFDAPGGKRASARFADEPTSGDLHERAKEIGATVTDDTVAKPFMAFLVWNYELEKIQIFQFSQSSIATPMIESLSNEEVEAEPTLYDFVLSAKGTGRDKRYNVLCMAGRRRKEAVDKQIISAWEQAKADGFDLNALLEGQDPFKAKAPF